MTKRPEALRLADLLEDDLADYAGQSLPRISQDIADEAASELRRLHAERTAADGVINDLVAKVRELQDQRDALLAEHQQTLTLQQRSYEREIQLEVEAEREECAKLCEDYDDDRGTGETWGPRFAALIRARTP